MMTAVEHEYLTNHPAQSLGERFGCRDPLQESRLGVRVEIQVDRLWVLNLREADLRDCVVPRHELIPLLVNHDSVDLLLDRGSASGTRWDSYMEL